MATQTNALITARDLLHEFVRLRLMAPDPATWTEEGLAYNPPRLYRLRRLVAMFRAYGIDWNVASFVNGDFIDPTSHRYDEVLERAAAELRVGMPGMRQPERRQLPGLFSTLLDYRVALQPALGYAAGFLEASGLWAYALLKIGELSDIIWKNCAIVEDVLTALISPEGRAFTVEQLKRDFGYPDVDLSEIDADWF